MTSTSTNSVSETYVSFRLYRASHSTQPSTIKMNILSWNIYDQIMLKMQLQNPKVVARKVLQSTKKPLHALWRCLVNCPSSFKAHHIWIIKVAWSSHLYKTCWITPIELYNAGYTVPGVLNVAIVPPHIAILCNPLVIRLIDMCLGQYDIHVTNHVPN